MVNLKRLIIAGTILTIPVIGNAELLDQPDLQKCFACVWASATYGTVRTEAAAWIIKTGDGFSCQMWPATHEPERQTIKANVDKNVMKGIVHTHPNGAGHVPSDRDVTTAKTLDMPNYVISNFGISKFDPAIGKITNVADNHFVSKMNDKIKKHDCDVFAAPKKKK